jgi:effector-binding domain-containing protein
MGVETERLKFKKIDRVPAAACLYHKGPYRTIRSSYALLFKWISDNGYVSSDCPRESYVDGIWNKEDENEWLTEIQIPISKK